VCTRRLRGRLPAPLLSRESTSGPRAGESYVADSPPRPDERRLSGLAPAVRLVLCDRRDPSGTWSNIPSPRPVAPRPGRSRPFS